VKILFLTLGVFGAEGGIERFNQRVIRSLSELRTSGIVSQVIVLSLWDGLAPIKFPSNVQWIGKSGNKLSTLFSFLKIIVTEKPDRIIYGHILFYQIASIAKVMHRNHKSLVFLHGSELRKKPSAFSRRAAIFGFDYFLPVSQYLTEILEENFKLQPSRIYPFPNAIDRPESPISQIALPGKYHLITISRLSKATRHKHIDAIIRAMPKILEYEPDTHLFIAGGGDLQADLQHLCTDLELDAHIHFSGWLDDDLKNAYLEKVDIFVLPSEEGFGIVYLEAWMHHLAVIAGNIGAAPEIVENTRGGLCVTPEPFDISQAVIKLLSDPRLRTQMGEFGYQKIQNNYLHKHFRKRLVNVLKLN
jgi:phosphatidyl-myo-inositol dimannoside synthase